MNGCANHPMIHSCLSPLRTHARLSARLRKRVEQSRETPINLFSGRPRSVQNYVVLWSRLA